MIPRTIQTLKRLKMKPKHFKFAAFFIIVFLVSLSLIFRYGTKDEDDADNTWRALSVFIAVIFYYVIYQYFKEKLKQQSNRKVTNSK
jgi:SNF family Na+-dependent transporter